MTTLFYSWTNHCDGYIITFYRRMKNNISNAHYLLDATCEVCDSQIFCPTQHIRFKSKYAQ